MVLKRLYPAAVVVPALLALGTMPDVVRAQGKQDQMQMEKVMSGWPKASREAVKFMTDKYGPPAVVIKDMAVWGKTGPWKRTIVYAQEYPHEFPMHHTDVMQQFIDYKAPPEMYDEIATYDGSVVPERTSGEISARCDKEGANFLALNLVNDLVTGKRKVKEARQTYSEQIMAMKAGKAAPYTEKLLFQVPRASTGDPDVPVMSMGMEKPNQ
jgi:hypothetical protein